jgi:hypothetical protein
MEYRRNRKMKLQWIRDLICRLRNKHSYETVSASGAMECKICGRITVKDPRPDTIPTAPTTPDSQTTPSGTDALPWDSINWLGQNKAKNALPTKVLRSVTVHGDNRVILDYDTNSDWPDGKCPAGVEGCRSSFMVFLLAGDGNLTGGHIDHMRLNAKERNLGNLYNGYLMTGVPRGRDLYIAIASHDGKQRSNMVKAIRK